MKKILIVEDEMIIAMVLKKYVEQIGHNVIAILKTGEEAIDTMLAAWIQNIAFAFFGVILLFFVNRK